MWKTYSEMGIGVDSDEVENVGKSTHLKVCVWK
jgi:hypothetical protein